MKPRSTSVRLIVLLLVVCAAAMLARAALHVPRGLNAEYFENSGRFGAPLFREIDREVSTDQVTADWLGDPPDAFGVRWSGYLTTNRPGRYTFALRSDDGSSLWVDGRQIVDNGGRHEALTRTGAVELGAGSHFVLIEYANEIGDYEMSWRWARDGEVLAAVPSWAISPQRAQYWRLVAARALDWLVLAAALAAALVGVPVLFRVRWPLAIEAVRRYPRAATLMFFAVLTIAETWPLAAHPARLSRNDNGDTIYNEWVMAWVAHQAPRAPLHL